MRIQTLCLALCVSVGGCATTSKERAASSGPEGSASTTPVTTDEIAAVPHKLNAPYRFETNPQTWVERFEKEGREVRDRKADVIAALGITAGQTVADIGAGTGLYTLDFARAVGPEGRVIAVDVHDYFLRYIDEKVEEAGLENVETVFATQTSVGVPADALDLAFFCDVFHHVEYPKTYLGTLFAAVKPGGRVAVIDFVRPDPDHVREDEKWLLEHVRASPQQFRSEFEEAGFVLVQEHDLLRQNFFFVFEKPR